MPIVPKLPSPEVFTAAPGHFSHGTPREQTLDELPTKLHSHVCWLWDRPSDDDEARRFLLVGLRDGDGCVVAARRADHAALIAWLAAQEVDAEQLRDAGRLRLIEWGEDAARTREQLETAWQELLAAGARRLRQISLVDWETLSAEGQKALLTLEAHLSERCAALPLATVCLHRVEGVMGWLLRSGILGTHPLIYSEGAVTKNPLFVPLPRFLAILDRLLRELATAEGARARLRASLAMFHAAFHGSPIPTFISTMDEGVVLDVNQSYLDTFGFERDHVLGRPVAELGIWPSDKPRAPVIDRLRRGEEVRNLEQRFVSQRGEAIDCLLSMTVADVESRRCLIGQVVDITATKRLSERLQRSNDELRQLSRRIQQVREEERTLVAREVHDELAQMLTALRLDLAWAERHLQHPDDQLTTRLLDKVATMTALLDNSLDVVQQLVAELRPVVLDELGLPAAVEWYTRSFSNRTGVGSRLRLRLADDAVDGERAVTLFRILQEALTNVARHADAKTVEVRLGREDAGIVLEVRDDGKGIPRDRLDNPRSLGLVGMRERAAAVGGELVVQRGRARGTTVRVTLPP